MMLKDTWYKDYTQIVGCKVFAKEVTRNDKTYTDLALVLPNGKDFQMIPNHHIYSKLILSLYKHYLLKFIRKSKTN